MSPSGPGRSQRTNRRCVTARGNLRRNPHRRRFRLADQFFEQYFLDRQSAFSTVLAELNGMADKTGIRLTGDNSTNFEPIEGSDNLAMMTVNGSYQGTYADLIEFVNAIDRSPRFLTIDRLQASPAQAPGTLSITMRLNVFVRGEVEPQ